jgi:nucleoside-diphosphate-sugar epimerase
MKILVIGGTKFIGKEIVKQCLENGHDVTLFNRGSNNKDNLPLIKGDINNILEYKNELLKVNPDIVIHCIAYSEKDSLNCVEIFKNTNSKILVLSSQDCYHDFQEIVRGKEIKSFPIDEKSPITTINNYWEELIPIRNEYDKNLMTNVFIESYKKNELNFTAFRLPMVYGVNDYQYQHRHASIIKRIIDKRKKAVLSSSEQNKIWTFGYIENIVAGIIHSFDKNITDGKIYNLSEKKSRSWRQWHQLFAEYNNWEFEFTILPDELINESKEILNVIPQHIISSSDLFYQETNFSDPVSLKDSIIRTYEYAVKNPEVLGEKIDYQKEDDLIKKYTDFLNS